MSISKSNEGWVQIRVRRRETVMSKENLKEKTELSIPIMEKRGIKIDLWEERTIMVNGSPFTYRVFDSDTVYKTPRKPYKPTEDTKQNEVVL